MAKWGSKGLTESGFRALVFFRGKWANVEEDLPSKFIDEKTGLPKTQTKFNFIDVEPLAYENPVKLEDGKLGQFYNDSSAKNSTWGRLQVDLEKFAENAKFAEHLQGPLPDAFYGVDLIWARTYYPMGGNSQPGFAFIPVDLGENAEKYTKGLVEGGSIDVGRAGSGQADKGPAIPDSLPDELVELVKEAAGEDGASDSEIRKAINKGGGELRKAMSEAGGVPAVIAYCVEHDHLVLDGDKYVALDGDGAEDEAEASE
jgi:hypothetical protein